MNSHSNKIQQNSQMDEVDKLIEECDNLNRYEESEISFELGQFNDQTDQFCQLNQTHSTSQDVITQTNHDFNYNHNIILNNNHTNNNHIQQDQQCQKSVYQFTDSQIFNQISKQIGYFDGSQIDNHEQRQSNNCNFNENLNNISDNYVEYIEKLLRNINIQEMQENEKSLEQAIQLANQNMNLDLNQQSLMLNSILQEINNMTNNNNNNNIINHDSNDIVVINQTSNESNKAELKFKKIEMENNPSITPFNQQNQQEQASTCQKQNKENIDQIIINNKSKNKMCNIFQMNFIYT